MKWPAFSEEEGEVRRWGLGNPLDVEEGRRDPKKRRRGDEPSVGVLVDSIKVSSLHDIVLLLPDTRVPFVECERDGQEEQRGPKYRLENLHGNACVRWTE